MSAPAKAACWMCRDERPVNVDGVCESCAPFLCSCGTEMEWVQCWDCGGDGEFDDYDTDPINNGPGEFFTPCSSCEGKGGWGMCPNCHPRAFDE